MFRGHGVSYPTPNNKRHRDDSPHHNSHRISRSQSYTARARPHAPVPHHHASSSPTPQRNSRNRRYTNCNSSVFPRPPSHNLGNQCLEQPTLSSLYSEYDQCVAAYNRSPRQFIKHPWSQDHVSKDEPIFHALFREVEMASMVMVQSIGQGIPSIQREHPSFANLKAALKHSSSPYLDKPMRVAVIGDIGVGKSYLVGTLLGDEYIVKDGSSGESLTRVILEYHYFAQVGSFRYSAFVCLFSWLEFQTMLEDCFQHLNNGLFPTEGEEETDIVDQKLSTAKVFFDAILRGYPCFRDDESTRKWLSDNEQPERRKSIRNDVLRWAWQRYVLAERQIANRAIYFQTAAQLWGTITPYTHGQCRQSTSMDHDPWPFVKIVMIGGKFPITERNVRIADTPGLNDVDHLNRDRTEHYLSTCSATIVTNTIDRVLSKSEGRAHLVKVKRRAQPDHPVVLVCTKSEDAQLTGKTKFTPDQSRDFAYWEDKKANLNLELNRCGPHSNTEALRFKLRLVSLRQTEVLVDERNDRIKEKVLGWPSPPARIFCVSAKDYRENAIGYRLGEVGKLPIEVERSEIPALMRYIAALSAQSQQRGLVTYISNTIPSLLNSLEIAFSHVASTYRFVLPGGIDGQLKGCIEKVNTEITLVFRNRVSGELLRIITDSMPVFLEHAELLCDKWGKWSAPSHRAFILNYGNHETATRRRESWNDTLLKSVRESMFDVFTTKMENTRAELIKTNWEVQSVLDYILSRLKLECPHPVPPALFAFAQGICMHKEMVKVIIDRHADRMSAFLLHQRERCCEDNGGNYFDAAMRPIYERASEASPKHRHKCSVHRLRADTFKAAVCTPGDNNPYMKIHDGLQAACKQEEAALKKALEEDISAIFHILADDLERTQELNVEQPDDLAAAAQGAMQSALKMARDCLPALRVKLIKIGVPVEKMRRME